jgi:environmental stress-induced protein Ves
MSLQHLSASSMRREPWRNGQGESLTVAVDTAATPRWRLSVVTIAQDTTYSSWPGYARQQALLRGNGLTLRFADRAESLAHIGQRIAFDGAQTPQASLTDGAVEVLNAFALAPTARLIDTMLRPVNGRLLLTRAPKALWLAYSVSARVTIDSDGTRIALEPGDGAQITINHAPWAVIDGGGELALAHFELESL